MLTTSAISATSSIERPYTPIVSSARACARHAGARDCAEGRFEAIDAAEGARADHRPLGLRAERQRHHIAGHGRRRAGRRSTGRVLEMRGLRVLLGTWVASSVVTVLPRMTAPAARSAAIQVASASGCRPSKKAEPCSVGMSTVSMMSLIPTGTPCSGPMPLPALRASSAALPEPMLARGRDGPRPAPAARVAAMRSRQALTSASDVNSPRAILAAASLAVREWRSAVVNGSLASVPIPKFAYLCRQRPERTSES